LDKFEFHTSLLATALFCAGAANADDTKIVELLDANSHPVILGDDGISGPGADLIIRLAEDAQFVALGEEHYNYYIPAIATALFGELQERYDYRYFMTEQDPVMMELMSRPPAKGDPKRINDLARRYPMGVTFNSDEELKMLADIGRISSTEFDVIWGCDQAAGVTHTLDQLALELDDEELLAIVQEKRDMAASKEHVRDFKTGFFISDTAPSWFAELRSAVDPEPGSREAWLLDVLINGNTVFDYYNRGEQGLVPGYYENNRFREEHLKDLCLDKYRQAEGADAYPKALMKFGSWHLYEGLSPTNMHTIGDFFANVARFNGFEFLSINFVSLPEDPEASMKEIGYAWPFISHLDPEAFAVVDLRPFRHYRNRRLLEEFAGEDWLEEYKEDFNRLVYSYDLLFFVGKTRPATFTVVPQPD
jgi:hypothetical protein